MIKKMLFLVCFFIMYGCATNESAHYSENPNLNGEIDGLKNWGTGKEPWLTEMERQRQIEAKRNEEMNNKNRQLTRNVLGNIIK